MTEYISLGLTIALLVFVFIGFLAGIIRGLKKTASRAIFLILTAIITLFITIPITNLLLDIKLNMILDIEGDHIEGALSVRDLLYTFITNLFGAEFSAQNPAIIELILSLPIMIINSFVYVIIFWLLKYLLLPINYIFYRLTWGKKKALGFSAFNDDNNNNNNQLGNIFDALSPSNNETSEQTNTQWNTSKNIGNVPFEIEQTSSQELSTEETQITDNSVFTPENIKDESGVFIADNTELQEGEDNNRVFDVSIGEKQQEPIEEPNSKKKKKVRPYEKKHRLLGGLLGMVLGLFVMSNTMLPIFGAMDILKEINKIKISHITETEISLPQTTDGISTEILEAYNNSILNGVTTYTGLKGLALAEFDYITTHNVGDKKIMLRSEIQSLTNTLNKVDNILGKYKEFAGEGNLSNLNKEQITILLNDAKTLINNLKDIEIVESATNYVVPITCALLLNSSSDLTDNDNINSMITDLIETIKSDATINIFEELTAIVELAEYLNNKDILIPIIRNDFSDPVTLVNQIDNELTDKIFAIKTIDIAVPHVLNIALAFLDESLEFGYVKNEASASSIKTAFSTFVDRTIEFATTLSNGANTYVTSKSVIPLGKLLHVAKSTNLLNPQTYTNLVDYAVLKLEKFVLDLIPEDFRDYAKNQLLNNVSKVDNWEYEMTLINDAIVKLRNVDSGIIGDVVEGKDLRQGRNINISFKEEEFVNLGETLDILEETCLFGRVTTQSGHQISGIASLMTHVLDYADKKLQDEDGNLKEMSSILTEIKTNIINSNHTFKKDEPTFWTNELTCISPLIVEMYNTLESEDFNFDNTLGKKLDQAKTSTMLGNGTTITLISVAMDIVEAEILGEDYTYNNGADISKPQIIDDKIYELFKSIDTNLKTNSVKNKVRTQSNFWEKELDYYIALKNVADKSTTLEDISDAVALSYDLDQVYNSYTIPKYGINKIIAFALNDVKYKDLTPDDAIKESINNCIDDMSAKLNSETFLDGKDTDNFWTIEFKHIENLTNIDFDYDPNTSGQLLSIGEELDSVTLGYKDTNNKNIRGSYLITHENLRTILACGIYEMNESIVNNFDADIKAIVGNSINQIRENVADTVNIPLISFKKELGNLETLSHIELSSGLVNYPQGTDAEIQEQLNENKQTLNELGRRLDSIAFNYKNTLGKFIYDDSKNSLIITRQIINEIIHNVFNLAKIDASDTKETSFNELIISIQNEIKPNTLLETDPSKQKDKLISWTRELGYVNTLVALNKDTVYTTENVATEIGKNIDTIAFNYNGTDSKSFNDIYYNNNDECIVLPIEGGNSLFITRSALLNTINGFLSEVKEEETGTDLEIEEKKILNDIIDNITLTISKDNTDLNSNKKYFNMESAFTDLNDIDSLITDTVSIVENQNIKTMNGSTDVGITFDIMLYTLESRPACYVKITRRIAILILRHINIPTTPIDLSNTEAGIYHSQLLSGYTSRIDSETSEDYYNNSPFETLFSKSIIPTT